MSQYIYQVITAVSKVVNFCIYSSMMLPWEQKASCIFDFFSFFFKSEGWLGIGKGEEGSRFG